MAIKTSNLGVRILLGVIVGMLGVGMLLYLVPGGTGSDVSSADVVAKVAGQTVSVSEVQRQLQRIQSNGQMPAALAPLYTQQIISQLLFERMLEEEAKRLGISVSEQEVAGRIKQFLPEAVQGDTFVGIDQYQSVVQARFRMTVPEFEELIRQSIVQDKIQQLVTSGVTVTPDQVKQEFQRKNEKVKLDYVVLNPDTLAVKVSVTDADLQSYYDKNKAKYVVPEARVVRYVQLDLGQIEQKTTVPEADLRAYYTAHLAEYRVDDRAHVADVLFKTAGKTDAEIAEIRKKADDVVKQARKGAKFEDLAKKYSDDANKDAGGDRGWILKGQALREYENVAFSLPKGEVSDPVQTQVGIYVIKVIDRETAHTKPFEEMLPTIMTAQVQAKAQTSLEAQAQKIGDRIRQSGRISIDDVAKEFGVTAADTKPLGAADTAPELGTAPELRDTISRQRVGDISQPIHTDKGYVVVSVKQINPGHQGTLAEVREKVTEDFRHDQAGTLAKTKASELAKRVQGGEKLESAAKAMGFETKTSDATARDGDISGLGSMKQLPAAFTLDAGKTADPVLVGNEWAVYRVASHDQPNFADFDKQKKDLETQLLESKRQMAFESFRSELEARMRREGKVTVNQEVYQRMTKEQSS